MTDQGTNLQCVHGRPEPEKVISTGAGFRNLKKNIRKANSRNVSLA